MKSPYDFANNISKMKLQLDYDNYIKEQENSYSGYSNYADNPIQEFSQNKIGSFSNSTAKSSKSNPEKGFNIVLDDIADIGGEFVDNDDYENKGGSRKVRRAMRKTSKISEGKDGEGFGNKLLDNAGAVAQFGVGQMSMFQNEAQSEKEGWASFGNSIASGASTGAAFGPIGAAVGAGVGLITGGVDFLTDNANRHRTEASNYQKMLTANTEKRKQDWLISQGEESVNKLAQLRKAQLNYINLDY